MGYLHAGPIPKKNNAGPAINERSIDWGNGAAGQAPDLEALIGLEDAFEHTLLLPGEAIAFCTRDKVAYHLATWEFLKQQNQGRCCICGQSNVIVHYQLPEIRIENVEEAVTSPAAPPSFLRPGEKVIG